jgi:hypothetical protein
LDRNHWLCSAGPVSTLSSRLEQTSQFTLGVVIKTGSVDQQGPARIVSVSLDTGKRNFTLGQQDGDLVFRMRTPMTEENGARPELTVPGVFADNLEHRIVVTYGDSTVRVFVDGVASSHLLTFNAGTAAYAILFEKRNVNWTSVYDAIYQALVFLPVGVLAALFLVRRAGLGSFSPPLRAIMVVLLAPALEGLAAMARGGSFRWHTAALGAAFTLLTAAFSLMILRWPSRGIDLQRH